MAYEEEFNRLEAVVEKLLESYSALKQKQEVLEASLEQKNQELLELRQSVGKHRDEKSQIHKRLTGLIDVVEKWEKLVEESGDKKPMAQEEQQSLDEDKETTGGPESQLFSFTG